MSKAETWVQRYRPPIEPGPDGAPVNVAELWYSSDIGAQWRAQAPYIERETTRLIRGGKLTQKWRRYLNRLLAIAALILA
ncbi:MAG: hypothetical protein ABIU97_08995, partial [Dehalococcoidia bacterium]